MIIFGVNLSHDEACAAVVDGEVKVAIENERLSRLKHNEGRSDFGPVIPFPAIRYCCDVLGIAASEVDLWVVNSVHRTARELLCSQLLGIDPAKIIDLGTPGHHLAHAYSAYFCSPFEDAAVIVLDTNGGYEYHRGTREIIAGGKDTRARQENYTVYAGRRGELREVAKDWIRPGEVGIGQLYMLYAAALQLTRRDRGYYGKDDALAAGGKLMGYAAYDDAKKPLPPLFPPRGSHLTVSAPALVTYFRRKGLIERGDPRVAQAWAHQLQRLTPFKDRTGSLRDRRWITLAGEAQRLLEHGVLRIAEIARQKTGLRHVCFAGGNALNITALTAVMRRGLFDDAFVQPAANDAGNAIGAAFFGYAQSGGQKRAYLTKPYSTFLGRTYSDQDIQEAIRQARRLGDFSSKRLTRGQQIARLLEFIIDGRVVAVSKGGSEFGPRALGHRSLLASARTRSMVNTLNRIKGREWYRPVAPVVCEEDFDRFFDGPTKKMPFMTFAAGVRDSARRLIPAARHVDGSARVQTVTEGDDPFLHALLKAHEAATGVPVLLNTSFNFGGEPIVETPLEAIASFLRTDGVACLLVGDYCLVKRADATSARSAGREHVTR